MLLRFSHTSCSSFAKFFLLKFTACYGDQSRWVDQVTEFIDAVDLPKSRFYKVVNELRSAGILEVQKSKPTEISRVRYQVKIKEPAIWKAVASKQLYLHERKIQQLLVWHSLPITERPHQLTVPQRILLIALLEEADSGGIIRNIGFSNLAQRTGLTIRQVKNQMSKLREFHYARVSLPGGNRTGITGRYNSVHALNLRHPSFGQQNASGGIVIFRQSAPLIDDEYLNFFYFQRRELLDYFSKRKHASSGQIDQTDELLKLANPAGNLKASSTWIFLNWLCHDLASRTLSELWSELSELALGELHTIIGSKIRGEWLSAYRALIEEDDDENPGQKKAVLSNQPDLSLLPLIEMSMCTAVRGIALGVKNALKDLKALPDQAQNYHFQILPIPHRAEHGHFALEITATDENQLTQTNAFALALDFNPKQGKVTVDTITDVYALKHSTLETTGLATPPLTCPILSKSPKRKSDSA